ncbi:MAG: KH domain-containing protein [Leptolyngbyaceae bacterium]|nr:KH domain-containing protein [Leptolyngbyaceae bacterium]
MTSIAPDSSHSEQTPAAPVDQPDYLELIRFLCHPFLDSPESLRIDCEHSVRTNRILVRLAIEGEDKGRVFGRGGRNLQAIRTVFQAVAGLYNQNASLEVFGSQSSGDRPSSSENPRGNRPPSNRRRRPPRPHRSKGSE